MKLSMHITMRSDWHVGTGTGRHGGIDRLIARDPDGLPHAPASTVRNVWRDAAEMLAWGLDNGKTGPWGDLVRELFGSQPSSTDKNAEKAPVSSLIRMTADATINPALRARLLTPKGRLWLRDAMTFVKPGVAIDSGGGTAKDDHLHFDEVAVGGVVLVTGAEVGAEVVLDGITKDDEDTVYRFLCGAACLIERLGGKRRRGLGKCEVLLTRDAVSDGAPNAARSAPPDLAALCKAAAEHLREATAPKVARAPSGTAPQPEMPPDGTPAAGAAACWWQVPVAIELLAPLVIADEVQGNVITTLDYIPGSVLLPIVAAAARRSGLQDVEGRIGRGELRVLPATIDIGGQRGLPVPMAWGTPKDAPKDSCTITTGILDERQRDKQVKPLRKGYVTPSAGGKARLRESVAKTLRTHNVIDDGRQTPTEEIGGVFSYEALATGQVFRSLVLLHGTEAEAGALAKELGKEQPREERLGRAKQAGYGRVSVTAAAPEKRTAVARHSIPDFLVVWFETDALLPAPDLSAATDLEALADAIARSLYPDTGRSGRDLFIIDPNADSKDGAPDRRKTSVGFLRTRRHQTWHALWGLPRPSLVAVQAGSVVMLRLREGVTDDRRRALEMDGIGERRAEGFGAVRVDDVTITQQLTEVTKEDVAPRPASQSGQHEKPSAEETLLLAAITERAWKRRIISRAEAVMSRQENRAEHLGFTASGSPAMSQLGALRSRLPPEDAADAKDVVGWIGCQKDKAAGRGHKPGWLNKVEDIATRRQGGQDLIWEILELPDDMPEPPSGGAAGLHRKLWAFAVTNTLLIAIRHHKRAGESGKSAREAGANAASVQGAAS